MKLDVIYEPRGQALEYAPLSTNPYKGCGFRCAYCYVPLATHQDRKEFDAGAVPRKDYLARLRRDAEKLEDAGDVRQVMFSFATDVYNPVDRTLTRPSLEILAKHCVPFCVLTKSGTAAVEDIDFWHVNCDAFACTLTSLDDRFTRKWEKEAALPAERIAGLRAFRERGIFTWVSLEPTLDVEHSLAIVEATHGFVDLYKVGRANYVPTITKVVDWRDYTLRMIDALQRLGARHYFKKDLQPHLPAGYPNPLRVPQHH